MSDVALPTGPGTMVVPSSYDGNKPPAAIEEDIARTRAELSETLDELERRLAPRQLMEKGVDMVRDAMDGGLGKIGENMRGNPLPLALIGAGVTWLLLSQTGGGRAIGSAARSASDQLGRRFGSVGERVGALAQDAKERAGGLAERAGTLASDAAARVRGAVGGSSPVGDDMSADRLAYAGDRLAGASERRAGYGAELRDRTSQAASTAAATASRAAGRASSYVDSSRRQIENAGQRFAEAMEDHPLMVGALGVLAGVTLALLLPRTRVEDETLGDARERVVDQARDVAHQAVDRARDIAGKATDAAVETARQELTGERAGEPSSSGTTEVRS